MDSIFFGGRQYQGVGHDELAKDICREYSYDTNGVDPLDLLVDRGAIVVSDRFQHVIVSSKRPAAIVFAGRIAEKNGYVLKMA